jgi:hypothetical protein
MAEVVQDLLGGNRAAPARQIFYAIIATAARIKLLKALLEEGPLNATKDEFYDRIIDEYKSLNGIRNGYIHGLWYTHDASGRMFFSERATDDLHFAEQREVKIEEIKTFVARMEAFIRTIIGRHQVPFVEPRASPETPLLQPLSKEP